MSRLKAIYALEVCDDCGDLADTTVWNEDGETYYLCDDCHPQQRVLNSTHREVLTLKGSEVKA